MGRGIKNPQISEDAFIQTFRLCGDPLKNHDSGAGASGKEITIAGTDPMDSNEVLRVRNIVDLPGTNGVRIQWKTETGRTYRVYAVTNLLVSWPTGPVHTTPGNGVLKSYTDTSSNAIERFYRLGVTFP